MIWVSSDGLLRQKKTLSEHLELISGQNEHKNEEKSAIQKILKKLKIFEKKACKSDWGGYNNK